MIHSTECEQQKNSSSATKDEKHENDTRRTIPIRSDLIFVVSDCMRTDAYQFKIKHHGHQCTWLLFVSLWIRCRRLKKQKETEYVTKGESHDRALSSVISRSMRTGRNLGIRTKLADAKILIDTAFSLNTAERENVEVKMTQDLFRIVYDTEQEMDEKKCSWAGQTYWFLLSSVRHRAEAMTPAIRWDKKARERRCVTIFDMN